jgi:uncharacterized damage-inducible protein DinB
MTVPEIRELFDYAHWANAKLFDVIGRLTPEELTQPISGSHGSIRDTMVHVLSAEWGWIDRCGGPARGPALRPAEFPTAESLAALSGQVRAHGQVFLAGLADADLTREVEFSFPGSETYVLSVVELLHHAVAHGLHHRGQVSLLLRLRGYAPENFDVLFYQIDKRRRR